MSHLFRLAFALFVVLSSTAALGQTTTTELRWVRGEVISNASGALLLQMRGDKRMSISCDERCAAAAPGAIVELHYVDRGHVLRGELLFADRAAGDLSKRPGRSVRGTVLRTKSASVQLQVGNKQRTYNVEKSTALIEDSQPAAIGRAPVLGRLNAGEVILLKYEEHDSSMTVGEVFLPGSELRAVEVRRLK
jgi:hypothetical protein